MAHIHVYNVGRDDNDTLRCLAGPIPEEYPNTVHKIRRATGAYFQILY
jgi:hypothetical protein